MKITRTITTTTVSVQAFNRSNNALETIDIKLIGAVKDVEKAVKKELFGTDYVFCALVDSFTESKLYAMEESKFVEMADCIGDGRK